MIDNLEAKKKIHLVFSEIFGISETEVTQALSKNDVWNWDSLGHLRLIMALEKAFKLNIDKQDVTSIFTISDIEQVILNHLGRKNE